MTMQAVCVDPAKIRQFWPLARDMIRDAMQRAKITDFEDVERDILSGDSHTLLWLAWNTRQILAAAVTQTEIINSDRYCTILGCGGSGKDGWMHLIGDLETFAKNEGCKSMRIWGRRGWERELPTYKVNRVMLEKAL